MAVPRIARFAAVDSQGAEVDATEADGLFTIAGGESVVFRWQLEGQATSVSLGADFGQVAADAQEHRSTLHDRGDHVARLGAGNEEGMSFSHTLTIRVRTPEDIAPPASSARLVDDAPGDAPLVQAFHAVAQGAEAVAGAIQVAAGATVRLTWRVLNATHVHLEPGGNFQGSSGQHQVTASDTVQYHLTAHDAQGRASTPARVIVAPHPADDRAHAPIVAVRPPHVPSTVPRGGGRLAPGVWIQIYLGGINSESYSPTFAGEGPYPRHDPVEWLRYHIERAHQIGAVGVIFHGWLSPEQFTRHAALVPAGMLAGVAFGSVHWQNGRAEATGAAMGRVAALSSCSVVVLDPENTESGDIREWTTRGADEGADLLFDALEATRGANKRVPVVVQPYWVPSNFHSYPWAAFARRADYIAPQFYVCSNPRVPILMADRRSRWFGQGLRDYNLEWGPINAQIASTLQGYGWADRVGGIQDLLMLLVHELELRPARSLIFWCEPNDHTHWSKPYLQPMAEQAIAYYLNRWSQYQALGAPTLDQRGSPATTLSDEPTLARLLAGARTALTAALGQWTGDAPPSDSPFGH